MKSKFQRTLQLFLLVAGFAQVAWPSARGHDLPSDRQLAACMTANCFNSPGTSRIACSTDAEADVELAANQPERPWMPLSSSAFSLARPFLKLAAGLANSAQDNLATFRQQWTQTNAKEIGIAFRPSMTLASLDAGLPPRPRQTAIAVTYSTTPVQPLFVIQQLAGLPIVLTMEQAQAWDLVKAYLPPPTARASASRVLSQWMEPARQQVAAGLSRQLKKTGLALLQWSHSIEQIGIDRVASGSLPESPR